MINDGLYSLRLYNDSGTIILNPTACFTFAFLFPDIATEENRE